MFKKLIENQPKTKSIVKTSMPYSQFVNLPNDKLLLVDRYGLRVVLFHDLNEIVTKKEFDGKIQMLGIASDNSILLQKAVNVGVHNILMRVSVKDCSILSKSSAIAYSVLPRKICFIDEQTFVSHNITTRMLEIYREKKGAIKCCKAIDFSAFSIGNEKIINMIKLKENQFCCVLSQNAIPNMNQFRILIFDIVFDKTQNYCNVMMTKEIPPSEIKTKNIWSCDPLTSCLLSNELLLIYNNQGASIWNIKEQSNCTPAWRWEDVKTETPIQWYNMRMIPSPDPTCVFVEILKTCYFFNIKDLTIKKINIPGVQDLGYYQDLNYHLLANGKLIAASLNQTILCDPPEMATFRKHIVHKELHKIFLLSCMLYRAIDSDSVFYTFPKEVFQLILFNTFKSPNLISQYILYNQLTEKETASEQEENKTRFRF